MGHKGANKLKPKKSKLLPHENLSISSLAHPNSNSAGQSTGKNNGINKTEKNPVAALNQKNRNGK